MFRSCIIIILLLSFTNSVNAQLSEPYVRIAKIIVDSAQLDLYKTELKTEMEAAVRLEPGVLAMYAVHDIQSPTHITILETYASKEAYQSHILTPHFKRYKEGTLKMVKALELIDVIPIANEAKKNN
jgi:quinol monooxygenase YgiN